MIRTRGEVVVGGVVVGVVGIVGVSAADVAVTVGRCTRSQLRMILGWSSQSVCWAEKKPERKTPSVERPPAEREKVSARARERENETPTVNETVRKYEA